MIYWKLFKNKYFWFILGALSLIAGIFSFFRDREKQKFIDQSPIMYCVEFRDSVKYPSVIAITDLHYAEEYVRYFSGESKKHDFRFYGIPDGCEVKILDEKYHGKLVKAVLVGKYPRNVFKEFWIWFEFVTPNTP
jgi:hypothetical protein